MISSMKQNWPIVCRFWHFVYVGFTYKRVFLYTIDRARVRAPHEQGVLHPPKTASIPMGKGCGRQHPQPLGGGQAPLLLDV